MLIIERNDLKFAKALNILAIPLPLNICCNLRLTWRMCNVCNVHVE